MSDSQGDLPTTAPNHRQTWPQSCTNKMRMHHFSLVARDVRQHAPRHCATAAQRPWPSAAPRTGTAPRRPPARRTRACPGTAAQRPPPGPRTTRPQAAPPTAPPSSRCRASVRSSAHARIVTHEAHRPHVRLCGLRMWIRAKPHKAANPARQAISLDAPLVRAAVARSKPQWRGGKSSCTQRAQAHVSTCRTARLLSGVSYASRAGRPGAHASSARSSSARCCRSALCEVAAAASSSSPPGPSGTPACTASLASALSR